MQLATSFSSVAAERKFYCAAKSPHLVTSQLKESISTSVLGPIENALTKYQTTQLLHIILTIITHCMFFRLSSSIASLYCIDLTDNEYNIITLKLSQSVLPGFKFHKSFTKAT